MQQFSEAASKPLPEGWAEVGTGPVSFQTEPPVTQLPRELLLILDQGNFFRRSWARAPCLRQQLQVASHLNSTPLLRGSEFCHHQRPPRPSTATAQSPMGVLGDTAPCPQP